MLLIIIYLICHPKHILVLFGCLRLMQFASLIWLCVLEAIPSNYIVKVWRMSKTINQKRNQMRQEIRKKERSDFFLKERMKILQNYSHTSSVGSLVTNLHNREKLPETLEEVSKIVNGVNFYNDTMKMVEHGLLHVLMSFLEESLFLKETLQIISYIIQKMIPQQHCINVYQTFYNFGLLEYMLKMIQNEELSSLCVFILYRFSEQTEDYCEALAFGGGYKVLIDQFVARCTRSKDPEAEDEEKENKFYVYIVCILESIVMMRDSALDLEANKSQIFRFCINLIEKRLFLKIALGLFYECLRSLGKNVGENYLGMINSLAADAPPDCRYLHNLLASVYLISPHQGIDYLACFKNAIKTPKLYKLVTLILEKMIKSDSVRGKIPLQQAFWEKLLINPQDEDTFKRILYLASQLPLDKDMMWRILSASLDSDCSLGVQNEALGIMHQKVMNRQREPNIINSLKKHQVLNQLQKLGLSKNFRLSQKANSLLDFILGPLTEMNDRIE